MATRSLLGLALCATPLLAAALKGRFISSSILWLYDDAPLRLYAPGITDMHPDAYYKYGGAESTGCHLNFPANDTRAGYFGVSSAKCDAPLTLIDTTFDYLRKFKHEVDFVVWTGDNVRHDNDSDTKHPRTLSEIYESNRYVAKKMQETFGQIPIVASIGNNDVHPHNILPGGPSKFTAEMTKIWSDFIPKDQRSTFTRGGYYSLPAAHNSLLLISLNSLLFYDANTAVRGCPIDDPSEAGNQHLLWIEAELTRARRRGQQVWLTGHVAPNGWVEDCYGKYGRIVSRFQDAILGHIFGHSNLDSFFWIDAKDVFPSLRPTPPPPSPSHHPSQLVFPNPPTTPTKYSNSSDRFETGFYTQLKELSQQATVDYDDYTIINMEPSIIPTYFPGFRLWQYDISKKDEGRRWRQIVGDELDQEDEGEDASIEGAQRSTGFLRFSKRTPPNTDLSHLTRHTSPHSPSRTKSYLTPLGYTQYYLPLPLVNENSGYGPGPHGAALLKKRGEHGIRPTAGWEIEYTTYSAKNLARSLLGRSDQPPSIPIQMLPEGIAEVVRKYRTRSGEGGIDSLRKVLRGTLNLVSYELEDLTIPSWLELGRTLGRSEVHWKLYLKRMFVSTGIERSW